jgi:hypothetical protein
MKATSRCRLAARSLAGPLLFTDSDVWAYYRLATLPMDYRSTSEAEQLAAGLAVGLAGLAGSHIQLIALPCRYPVDAWARRLHRRVYRAE